ncbi:hypothetical protein LIER_41393 [Lithospermum erythrorhizon]|uniref:Glucosidase II beta subunit N-terminal domain-containing protein n=1 Tax=Lithospermum erythrorhizon TaxID=34254 RepID=A0AAV3RAP5_LITER
MSLVPPLCLLLSFYFFSPSSTSSLPRGIHPLDEKYYEADVIKCKDGSKDFSKERLNDDFCDCPDGTDEPGTHFTVFFFLTFLSLLFKFSY